MAESISMDSAREVREFPRGRVEVVTVGSSTFTRSTMQPGWRWSECVRPIVGTQSCRVQHDGYAISGSLRVRQDDGTEVDINAGDAYSIPAGHDGWVVGDEPWVGVDVSPAMAEFAKPASEDR
jgi:mannose-6-phosphate isomerase-like protein (cupin superfamily)